MAFLGPYLSKTHGSGDGKDLVSLNAGFGSVFADFLFTDFLDGHGIISFQG
jgi:hypothetical protein